MIPSDTQELMRPDLEEVRITNWWQVFSCEHCWHEDDVENHEKGTAEKRYCCECYRREVSRLQPVAHGVHLRQCDRNDVALIWTPWKKWSNHW